MSQADPIALAFGLYVTATANAFIAAEAVISLANEANISNVVGFILIRNNGSIYIGDSIYSKRVITVPKARP